VSGEGVTEQVGCDSLVHVAGSDGFAKRGTHGFRADGAAWIRAREQPWARRVDGAPVLAETGNQRIAGHDAAILLPFAESDMDNPPLAVGFAKDVGTSRGDVIR
jgi:hypothetical protein